MTALIFALAGFAIAVMLKKNRTVLVLFCLLALVLVTTACGSTLGAISAMLPALATLAEDIIAFAVGLTGGVVSPVVMAAIQGWGTKIGSAIAVVQQIISDEKANPTVSTFEKIQIAMQDVMANFTGLLADVNVTNSVVVKTITALVGLGVVAVNAILLMVSQAINIGKMLATHKLSASELKAADTHGTDIIKAQHKILQDGFKVVVDTETPDANVNKSLAALTPLP